MEQNYPLPQKMLFFVKTKNKYRTRLGGAPHKTGRCRETIRYIFAQLHRLFICATLHSFVLVNQTRTVWSLEQDAMREPSDDTLTCLTHSLWPENVLTQYLKKKEENLSFAN